VVLQVPAAVIPAWTFWRMGTFIFPARTRTCYRPVRYLATTLDTLPRVTTVGIHKAENHGKCRVSDSRLEEDENWALLGCYAASSGNFLSTFCDNLSVPIFNIILEDGTARLSRNVGKKLQLLAA